jgi:predicted kinase
LTKSEKNHPPTGNQGIIIQEARKRARLLLAARQNFIWNSTNITLDMRTTVIDLFLDYKAKVNIVYVEAPYKTVLARNAKRSAPAPELAISRMVEKLSVPKIWEDQAAEYHLTM